MEWIPKRLREAVEELEHIGQDPNHTDEQLREAMKLVHEAREYAIINSQEYAEMLRRKAEIRERKRLVNNFGFNDLPRNAVLRHQGF